MHDRLKLIGKGDYKERSVITIAADNNRRGSNKKK